MTPMEVTGLIAAGFIITAFQFRLLGLLK